MQYKIPVQIENEDPIVLWLSLRQLMIIVAWGWLAYMIFTSLSKSLWWDIALLIAFPVLALFIAVAIFKYSEMTFIPFVLAFIRYKVNLPERKWTKWVDSFWALDIGYIAQTTKVDKKVDFWDKLSKIKKLDDQLEKI